MRLDDQASDDWLSRLRLPKSLEMRLEQGRSSLEVQRMGWLPFGRMHHIRWTGSGMKDQLEEEDASMSCSI